MENTIEAIENMLQSATDETIRVVEIINDLNSKWRTLKGYFPKPVNFIIGGSKRDHPSNGEKQFDKKFPNILNNTII